MLEEKVVVLMKKYFFLLRVHFNYFPRTSKKSRSTMSVLKYYLGIENKRKLHMYKKYIYTYYIFIGK